MIDKLLEDHARLRRHAHTLLAAVADPGVRHEAVLEQLRWTLARESLQHLAADERMVLVPIERDGTPDARKVAAHFRADLEQFNATFRQHMEYWTGSRVRRVPQRYAAAVSELVARLEHRLDREERELYPLAAKLEQSIASAPSRNWAGDAWSIRGSIAA